MLPLLSVDPFVISLIQSRSATALPVADGRAMLSVYEGYFLVEIKAGHIVFVFGKFL